MIDRNKVGKVSGSFNQLVLDVNELIEEQQLCNKMGHQAKDLIDREFIRSRNVVKLLAFIGRL